MINAIERVEVKRAMIDQPPHIKVLHGLMNYQRMDPHRHDFLEIVLVLGGSAVHMANGLPHPVQAGDLVVITGDMTHGYENTRDLEIGNVAFQWRVLVPYLDWLQPMPGFARLFGVALSPSQPGAVHHLRLYARHLAELADLIRRMEAECSGNQAGFETLLTGLLLQFIATLCRICEKPGAPIESDPVKRIARVLGFMNEHYMDGEHENITLDGLARHAHMSTNNLIRIFKQTMDIPPIEYLIRLRIRKACDLLADPERQIKDIAFDVGFNDSNYFTRQFRRIMGMPPSEFRQRPGSSG